MSLTFGSLFSGIGGLDLGFERAGMKCLWQVENDPYCQSVLAKHWPNTPRYEDIYDVKGEDLDYVDVIAGGFPCQPFSHAGKRSAEGDDRYLWPQMLRIIRERKPAFVVAENVYGLTTIKKGLVFETVYLDLEEEGYEVAPAFVFPAAAVGALHRRDRTWICAYSRHYEGSTKQELQQENRTNQLNRICRYRSEAVADAEEHRQRTRLHTGKESEVRRGRPSNGSSTSRAGEVNSLAHTQSQRREGLRPVQEQEPEVPVEEVLPGCGCEGGGGPCRAQWEAEPSVGRVVDGFPGRVAQLKGLGNAVVPQVAELIARSLIDSIPD